MKRLLVLPLFAVSAATFAAPNPDAAVAVDVALAAGKMHEVCAALAKGDKRSYRWASTAPVDFNIHYHQGKEVFYPVRHDAKREESGTFTAKIAQDYCWMWTARDAPATVKGAVGGP